MNHRSANTSYEWGLALRNKFPRRFFDIRERSSGQMTKSAEVRHGQLWFVLFEGAHVRLKNHQGDLQCDGCIKDGEWMPLREAPASPMVTYLYLTSDEEDPDVDIALGGRPGLLLGEPHSKHAASVSLLDIERPLDLGDRHSPGVPIFGD